VRQQGDVTAGASPDACLRGEFQAAFFIWRHAKLSVSIISPDPPLITSALTSLERDSRLMPSTRTTN